MSFRCDNCKRHAVKPTKVVTETREKFYQAKIKDIWGNVKEIIVGQGREIVREKNVCGPCIGSSIYKGHHP